MSETRFALAIEGMHCGGCVRRVTQALQHIEGVTLEKVEIGNAEGTLDPSDADLTQLVEAVNQLGFRAEPRTPAGA